MQEYFKEYPDVLTPEQAKKILEVGKNKIYELLKNGKINNLRIGNQYRIPQKYLYDFLFNNTQITI